MASWVRQILEANPDLAAMPVVKRARRSLHLRRPDGKTLGLFTGAPCHYEDDVGEWQPLDTTPLYDGERGVWHCPGLGVVITETGMVQLGDYSQHTKRVGLFRPSTKRLLGTRNVPLGSRVGDALIAEGDWWRVERRITDTGYRETLTLKEQPSVPQAKAGDFLVLETLVTGVSLLDGWVEGQYSISEHWSPLPVAWDANMEPLTCRRYWQDGVLYTGIPVSELAQATYPVTIDPDFTGYTSDGWTMGVHADYPTARLTSTNIAMHQTFFQVGQILVAGDYKCFRTFQKFDTSGIGGGQNITQVNLKMIAVTDGSVTDFDVQIVKQDWSAQDPPGEGNREAIYDGCLAGDEDDSIWRNTNGIVTGTQYTSGNLDTDWPDPLGDTYYTLRSSRDLAADVPTGNEYLILYSFDEPQANRRPVLTILYEEAPGETVSFLGIVLAASASADDAILEVERAFSATVTASSTIPSDTILGVEFQLAATALAASATPDDAVLDNMRLFSSTASAVSVTPDDAILSVEFQLAAALTAVSATPTDVMLSVERNFSATATANSASPDDVALEVIRVLSAILTGTSVTPDDAVLSIPVIIMAASISAVTTTPDIVVLAVERVLSAVSLAATTTPDTASLVVLRALQAALTALSATPDDADLQILAVAFQAAILASSTTPDDASLLILRLLQATVLAVSSAPDLAVLSILAVVLLGFVEVTESLFHNVATDVAGVGGLVVDETLLGKIVATDLGDK